MKLYNNTIKIVGEGASSVGQIFAYREKGVPFSPFDLPIEVATKDSIEEFDTDYLRVSEAIVGDQVSFITLVSKDHPCNELLNKIYKKWSTLLRIENEYFCPDDYDKGEFSIDVFGTREE